MASETSLSVVIPVMNEEDSIGKLITEIHSALNEYPRFEIVIVDDGSSDQTLAMALATAKSLECPIQTIRHERNAGQSCAVKTGVRYARGDLIVTIDGDGQNDPADIPAMLRRAETIGADDFCIAGYRKNRKDTPWKCFQSRLANRVRNALLHDGVPDTGCGLKVLPRETFLKLPWFNHGHRFIPALVKATGGLVDVVEVNHRHREQGISKYSAWNRAWVGIVDLMGVMWLIRRMPVIRISEPHDAGQS
ncbi:glycosyltransferase family 2 protein [Marinobacter sediminum]|uniref:glycosyltransferase family 2 protein n=1 Tax=Marinobacter sediminum TaxID=256323 RepID=UPI00202EDB8A|nr:glycosyltransferase family 2 protein [Marinobacter sediminum]MCM0613876.1 glycosyltransferase family 2 protein [Marinobacter sediminum]